MGPRGYKIETVENVFVEFSKKKEKKMHNPLTKLESSDKKINSVVESTDKQWNPKSFCFKSLQLQKAKMRFSAESKTKHVLAFNSKIRIVTGIEIFAR